MPFQSEKQRKYLWANEPEIARDWTDTYGSGIAKALGGRIGFYQGGHHSAGSGSSKSKSSSSQGMSPGAAQARGLGAQHHGSTSSWGSHQGNVGSRGGEGFVPGIGTVRAPKRAPTRTLGAPDFVTGFASQFPNYTGISPKRSALGGWGKFVTKMRGWNEEEDRPNTQKEYEDARQNRRDRSSIDRLRKTRDRGKYANNPQGWEASELSNKLNRLEKEQFGSDYIDYGRNRDIREEAKLREGITGTNAALGTIFSSPKQDFNPAWSNVAKNNIINPSGKVNYASMFPNFKNIGSNIMKGANWLADRGSNIMMNQVPNRFLDYMKGTRGPVTDLREIAPTRSTQDVLMQGIASNIGRKGYDFSNPFSSVVQSTGGGGEHGVGRTVDYGGYKLGNPLKAGFSGSLGELSPYFNMLGGSAENQIANTLGDYTVNYTPKLDPNHPEVMNISDIYDFRGKAGEGWGTPYDINVNLSPQMIGKIKGMNYNQGGLASLWQR